MDSSSQTDTTVIEAERPGVQADGGNGDGNYTEANIRVLEGIEAMAQRPGMYIGDTTPRGLHHLVYEVVDNSIDEAMAGHCKDIHVTVHVDGSVSVVDDGRGIPVGTHPQFAPMSTLEVVLTKPHAGGKFDHDTYKVSGGLHGVGVTVVNALSEWLEAEVHRDGQIWKQLYARGLPQGPVHAIGPAKKTGTKITFLPDHEIFPVIVFDHDRLEKRVRELSYLNKGIKIRLTDERSDETKDETFLSSNGLSDFVVHLNEGQEVIHPPVVLAGRDDDRMVEVEVAIQYNKSFAENVVSYCNNINTIEGGTHLTGFRSALTRTLNKYAKDNAPQRKKDLSITGEDFKEGLTAIISVKVPDPQFEGQTKTKLGNGDVEGIVTKVVNDKLGEFLETNPTVAKDLIAKALLAAEAREAAAKARAFIRGTPLNRGGGLPGKLMDCTNRDQESSELFLVEGDSAGGTAEGGRDRMFQAILPLRGKILNVERARLDRVLGNEEIRNIITAIGNGIAGWGVRTEGGNTPVGDAEDASKRRDGEDPSKRRYGKIVMMSDADVDGSHIRTLLMTFFYRQMPRLVAEGHLYVAQPPLYLISHKKDRRYVQTEPAMQAILVERGLDNARLYPADSRGVAIDGDPGVGGDRLKMLHDLVTSIDTGLRTFGRRNRSLRDFLKLAHPETGLLPTRLVGAGGTETPIYSEEQWIAYRKDHPGAVADEYKDSPLDESESSELDAAPRETVTTLHEVTGLNKHLARLRDEFGLRADVLLRIEVTGDDPPARFVLDRDGERHDLHDLRALIAQVRSLGEKGIKITRFKGLGEMDAEQLWETTMDPTRRTLLQVRLEDAASANKLFTTLMGDDVEPRRNFIEKHALEVKNLDV